MLRFSLRLSVLLWGTALLVAVKYGVSRLLVFRHIFFNHAGIAITQPEAAAAYAEGNERRAQLIPKIIHQVFHNWKDPGSEEIPPDWGHIRRTCTDANPGWEYKLWTERTSREFLEEHYPWFLRTYDGYRYPVQRVDAVRYFLLAHYGGIYLDLDNGCRRDLTPLLYYPAWVTEPGRGALSNNILASSPDNPFWTRVTLSLIPWDHDWFFPYVTISYASGQWFVTAVWQEYHSLLPPPPDTKPGTAAVEHRMYRLMMDDREGADAITFFTQERGGTWKNWDNYFFLLVGEHLLVSLLVLVGGVGFLGWFGVRICRRYKAGFETGYRMGGYARPGSTSAI